MNCVKLCALLVCLSLLAGCDEDSGNTEVPISEARQLLERFGDMQPHFTEAGMQGLLDYEETGQPVSLLQLMSVSDSEAFTRYEAESAALWQSVGAGERFSSKIFDQLVGDRPLQQTRVIEFASARVLLSAIDTPAFTDLMNTLAAASDDNVWVLGEQESIPFKASGSFFDPALQGLDEEEAISLLASSTEAQANGGESGFQSNTQAIIDMVVSDAPSPFWMVNLINFYDVALFPDGRETDLSGQQANEIYSRTILPTLLSYNSLVDVLMPVVVTLTDEAVAWEQAAIVRYASRDAFLNAFPLNDSADEALQFKEAGVEDTLVYASEVPGTVLPAPMPGPLFDFRYCEVLLFYPDSSGQRADVYNSMLLGSCPQDLWNALNAEQIAQAYNASAAGLNGVRFWVLDLIQATLPPQPSQIEDFGGIPMRLAASVLVAAESEGEAVPYRVNRVSRDTVFHYAAGRQVYQLHDPNGTRYQMQSFTRANDPDQQLVDLQRLGGRLDLPEGWSFHVILLEMDFQLETVAGFADVIIDDFGNTYQRIP